MLINRACNITPRGPLSSLLRQPVKKVKESSSLATFEENIRENAKNALLKELDVKEDVNFVSSFTAEKLATLIEEEVLNLFYFKGF